MGIDGDKDLRRESENASFHENMRDAINHLFQGTPDKPGFFSGDPYVAMNFTRDPAVQDNKVGRAGVTFHGDSTDETFTTRDGREVIVTVPANSFTKETSPGVVETYSSRDVIRIKNSEIAQAVKGLLQFCGPQEPFEDRVIKTFSKQSSTFPVEEKEDKFTKQYKEGDELYLRSGMTVVEKVLRIGLRIDQEVDGLEETQCIRFALDLNSLAPQKSPTVSVAFLEALTIIRKTHEKRLEKAAKIIVKCENNKMLLEKSEELTEELLGFLKDEKVQEAYSFLSATQMAMNKKMPSGKIPAVLSAEIEGMTKISYPTGESSREMKKVFTRLQAKLKKKERLTKEEDLMLKAHEETYSKIQAISDDVLAQSKVLDAKVFNIFNATFVSKEEVSMKVHSFLEQTDEELASPNLTASQPDALLRDLKELAALSDRMSIEEKISLHERGLKLLKEATSMQLDRIVKGEFMSFYNGEWSPSINASKQQDVAKARMKCASETIAALTHNLKGESKVLVNLAEKKQEAFSEIQKDMDEKKSLLPMGEQPPLKTLSDLKKRLQKLGFIITTHGRRRLWGGDGKCLKIVKYDSSSQEPVGVASVRRNGKNFECTIVSNPNPNLNKAEDIPEISTVEELLKEVLPDYVETGISAPLNDVCTILSEGLNANYDSDVAAQVAAQTATNVIKAATVQWQNAQGALDRRNSDERRSSITNAHDAGQQSLSGKNSTSTSTRARESRRPRRGSTQ